MLFLFGSTFDVPANKPDRQSTASLLKMHSLQLYPLILAETPRSPMIVEEVCEAFLDMEGKQFLEIALPNVLPRLVVTQSEDVLQEVSLPFRYFVCPWFLCMTLFWYLTCQFF